MWDRTSRLFGTALLLFSLLSVSNSFDTLEQTETLANGQTLVSLNSDFELGFFNRSTSTTKWYIGIWYTVSPEIVVWVANHDNPLNDSSSTLSISNGTLVLIDSLQNIIWSSSVNLSTPKILDPILKLLDSGNLILKDQNNDDILWQSFDYPSNTFLLGMKIGKDLTTGFEWYMSSWKSSDDPSKGNYYYKMNTIGQPEMVLWDGDRIKFKTGAWVGVRFSGLPEMQTYTNMLQFIVVSTSKEVNFSIEANKGVPLPLPLSRIVLYETGVIKCMVWGQDKKNWYEFWSWPNDMCDNYDKCGPFGGCERTTPLNCQEHSNGFKLVKR
ncbi:G-type lectin S-receptor-like Serine/Threonine-kinase [Rhynchospora pubera]|uniref:non-specific serine/threonine protein kinase n=1 Tax=Rhynchospora pubera TaxID=906938 RepID=A0AAV8BYX3_9POAL|nr:G-type lectin S-receptor-like Serine/Threonine-kinase [Rhynchospora pubera]